MSDREILPCPFCGYDDWSYDWEVDIESDELWHPKNDCMMSGDSYDIETWNKQAEVTRLQAEVKAWRELCVRKSLATCKVCGRSKQPYGRSAPLSANYCDGDCEGYRTTPFASQLWPGECYDAHGLPSSPPEVEE